MAYSFDGTNDYVEVVSVAPTAYPVTMACWVYVPTAGLSGENTTMCISQLSVETEFLLLKVTTSNTIQVFGHDGVTRGRSTSTTISGDTWHHICGVFTSSTDFEPYLDNGQGTPTDDATNTVAFPESADRTALGALRRTTPQYLNGRVAEAGIWTVALAADERAALAAGVSPLLVRPDALVNYIPAVSNASDPVNGTSFTVSGATIAAHPRIIHPTAQIIPFAPAAGAAAGGVARRINSGLVRTA